ncbi:hypothetical protein OAA12_04400 [Akkermansiaceae bacterium]|nr:hypothetical protein [Akkermansiaceae bacterium]
MKIILKMSAVCLTLFHLASCGGTTEEDLNNYRVYRQKTAAGLRTTDKKAKEAASIHGRLSSSQVTSRIREGLKDPKAGMFKNVRRIGLVTMVSPINDDIYKHMGIARKMEYLKQFNNNLNRASDVGDLWEVTVNAKNGYGAYTGYKTQYYIHLMASTHPKVGTVISKKGRFRLIETLPSVYRPLFHDQ